MALTEFEKKRQENIQRNKELLSKLNLDSISSSISNEIQKSASPPVKKRKYVKKPKQEVKQEVEPTRRSRRLAGIKSESENPEEYNKMREEEEEKERKKKDYEKLKRTRLYGDFKLIDLITDKKGDMIFENKVIKKEENDPEINLDDDKKVLNLIQSLGDRFSAGDFYQQTRKLDHSDKSLDSKRKEFDKLKIHPKFDPLDIKISHNRITTMFFHPSTTDRIIAGGDTAGNVGIWAVDDTNDQPSVTILHPHGKNVSKILTTDQSFEKLITSAYDGSVRSLDLNKLKSTELVYLNDPYESGDFELGVTDINVVRNDQNVIYMTTLDGHFYHHDIRQQFKLQPKKLLRLHDKKIGGFSINPNNLNQIATASLDRSLRIWDLRNVNNSIYSDIDQHGQKSPHMYGNYTSRLSISSVDWNSDNHLVCNGYDDNICLFNFNQDPIISDWKSDYVVPSKHKVEQGELLDNLTPFNKIKHNCQTGRWVSILKSRWQYDPKDGYQKFVIANMNRGLDVYNQQGQQIAHLNDHCGAVPASCTLHPIENWAVGGSASGKVYLYE